MRKIITVVAILFLAVYTVPSSLIAATQNIPKIKVMWRSYALVSVLVAPTTTSEQLKALIYAFRKAKKEGSLSQYIPATTPGVKGDPHQTVMIFVFSDPKWASEFEYKKYERAGISTQKDKSISKEYLNHIRASYEYDFIDGKEYGALGYDIGTLRSSTFKKLF